MAWLSGCAIFAGLDAARLLPLEGWVIASISIGSGLIGFFAILPFYFVDHVGNSSSRESSNGQTPEPEAELGLFVAFSIGMGIRVVGTVALLLACRYQMGESIGLIAAVILAWYVFLTLVEIVSVVLKSRVSSPGSVAVAGSTQGLSSTFDEVS